MRPGERACAALDRVMCFKHQNACQRHLMIPRIERKLNKIVARAHGAVFIVPSLLPSRAVFCSRRVDTRAPAHIIHPSAAAHICLPSVSYLDPSSVLRGTKVRTQTPPQRQPGAFPGCSHPDCLLASTIMSIVELSPSLPAHTLAPPAIMMLRRLSQ